MTGCFTPTSCFTFSPRELSVLSDSYATKERLLQLSSCVITRILLLNFLSCLQRMVGYEKFYTAWTSVELELKERSVGTRRSPAVDLNNE